MVNAVVSMDGVEKQINIVIWRKVVNLNLENVKLVRIIITIDLNQVGNVVRSMVHVKKDIVVPNMDGVEKAKIIVERIKDVNPNSVNAGIKNKITNRDNENNYH